MRGSYKMKGENLGRRKFSVGLGVRLFFVEIFDRSLGFFWVV